MMNEQRTYLAVPLTPSEAEYLCREAGNQIAKPCCDHLDVFHSSGRATDGGDWRHCTVPGCGCYESNPPPAWYVEADARVRNRQRRVVRGAIVAWPVVALIVGLTAGFFFGMHVVERVRPPLPPTASSVHRSTP